MAVEGSNHVRNVGWMVALSLIACRRVAGFVAVPPPSAAGALREGVGFRLDERPGPRHEPQGRSHHLLARKRAPHPLRLRHHASAHPLPLHLRGAGPVAARTSPIDRRKKGVVKAGGGGFPAAGRRFARLAASADPSPAGPGPDADDADDDSGSNSPPPPPPQPSGAEAPPAEGPARPGSPEGGSSRAASVSAAGKAGRRSAAGFVAMAAAGEEAAAAVALEEKGSRTGKGKKVRGDGRGLAAAAGPAAWAPRWAVDMHPGGQAAASVGLYFFHMLHLSKSGVTFPIQLIPNNHGLFQSIGLDTAAGFVVLGVAAWSRLRSGMPLFPSLGGGGVRGERGGEGKGKGGGGGGEVRESVKVPWKLEAARVKKKLPLTFAVLIMAYLVSGLGSTLSEYFLYGLSYLGIGMSVAMHRSLQVLMSHLAWVYMGVKILSLAVKSFFDREKGSWVGMKWKSNWLWWVVGGYFVSSSLFNMADLANQFLCPLPPDTESVVVKIINPENNDVAAMAVGSIAPCISAPWWEEVLYRGFLLPALTLYLPLKAALPAGSFLFAAHHMNLQAMLPLSVLGLVWSLLYLYSRNLLVTVLIHAMWNSRVFLGSLLGL